MKSRVESVICRAPRRLSTSRIIKRRSGCGKRSGLSSTVFTTVKMAELAPMPSVRVSKATAVNPGLRTNTRIAYRTSLEMPDIGEASGDLLALSRTLGGGKVLTAARTGGLGFVRPVSNAVSAATSGPSQRDMEEASRELESLIRESAAR
jgi:hypothetical protein